MKEEISIVKKVCREYGITQIELAKRLDIPRGTISRWVSTGNIPRTANLALNLMIKNRELERQLDTFRAFKEALNRLS